VTCRKNIYENDCLQPAAWDINEYGMKKVEFIFFDAGGGHRSAANALKSVVEEQARPWEVRLFNMQEELDSLDIFKKITRIRFQDLYNRMLAKGWTLGSEYLLPPMHGIIRLFHRGQVKMLTDIWRRDQPDLVVSVVPNFNRALFQSVQAANPSTPFVTILTDFADYPPHFWLEDQDHFVICGTERAYQQALATGKRPEKTFLVSGMILRPAFYKPLNHDRAAERRKLGLDPGKRTALMLFGGEGSNAMLKIARDLQESDLDLQLIAMCGKNTKLADRIRSLPARVPMHVAGFTSEIPYYMSLSDFFIGKPGPGSISEAIAMKLPVIVQRNAWTLPQERYNADWVIEKKVGIVVESFNKIRQAVTELLEPARFREYQANVAAIDNRAVFEIVDILDRISESGRG
jgi:UDP-N-acetylglucosamine:LPS N-acetylglucosamine transferase